MSARGVEVAAKPVGEALVVHRAGAMTDAAQRMAMALPRDPDHDLVVLDLPAELPISVWEAVERLLPRHRRGVRLVVGGRSRETVALIGHLLAERLGRTVIAPDGTLVVGAGGALLVHSGPDSGWVRFRPGKPHRPAGQRFPSVSWECDAFADVVETSSTGEVEPLPGGLWLRPAPADDTVDRHRSILAGTVPTRPDVLTVVVGCPGAPAVSTDDVARLWLRLPEELRPMVRFAPYGPVHLPAERAFGAAFAQLVQASVRCYTGLPVGDAAKPDIVTVTPDGTPGWSAFARELCYPPEGEPTIVDHRPPLSGLTACGPATYWYAPDAVVEVVPCGLLVRGADDTAATPRVRAAAPDATVNQVVVDPADATGTRLHALALDLVRRLDEGTRRASRVVRVDELGRTPRQATPRSAAAPAPPVLSRDEGPALLAARPTEVVHPRPAIAVATPTTRLTPDPALAAPARTEVIRPPEPTPWPAAEPPVDPEVRAQPTPSPEASALPPDGGIDKEREWLRRTLQAQFDAASDDVADALRPLFGEPPADLVTDGVVIGLYLSPRGTAVDDALRSGTPGPHVPIARSVSAGLSRLPAYQGAATYPTTMTAADAEYYRRQRVVTEWGFRNALTVPADLPGDTDVLLWSVTARATAPLESDRDGVPERVLFRPGTRFTVLDLAEPTEASRGVLMLREMTADEGDEPDPALDMTALDLLWDSRDDWRGTGVTTAVPAAAAPHFTGLPGLVSSGAPVV